MGVITILLVHLLGLLDYETARVWLFFQPLVIVPIALELARLPGAGVGAVLALQWLIVATIKSRMLFLEL